LIGNIIFYVHDVYILQNAYILSYVQILSPYLLLLLCRPRAYVTYQEALKCDFENWRIWENFLAVSNKSLWCTCQRLNYCCMRVLLLC